MDAIDTTLHDPLTGLPGRAILEQRLREPGQSRLALLVLGVDGLRAINEDSGHATGDALLRELATRLQQTVRGEDLVARLDGDKFAVLAQVEEPVLAVTMAKRLLLRMQKPFSTENGEMRITVSIGTAIDWPGGHQRWDLLDDACLALRASKDAGRNCYRLFDASMPASNVEIELMGDDLRQAMQRGELFLLYQPQLDLATGRILGVEALLRWNHRHHGAIVPDQFIPLAEKTGMIGEIGTWALNEACRQMRQWRNECEVDWNVAVNISVYQLNSPHFFDTVCAALERHGLEPGDLMLEVTESNAMRNPELALTMLRRLASIGVGISLDDFGVGHSSLSNLKRLPVSELKVDRSFVRDIERDAEDMAIVSAIVSLAKALGLKVVAEGVETAEQKELLMKIGCNGMQGYLIGHPSTPDEVVAIIAGYDADRRKIQGFSAR